MSYDMVGNPVSEMHYVKMDGQSSLVHCSLYWSIGSKCPWCGTEPPKGYYCGTDSTSQIAAPPAAGEKE
jgi:hypothetical protein